MSLCYFNARNLLGQSVKYYNWERLHSVPNYLRPVDYQKGIPDALLADPQRKLKEADRRRKGVNSLILTATKAGGLHFGRVDLSQNDPIDIYSLRN